jgi:ribose-phosphate pyrophosphokinase
VPPFRLERATENKKLVILPSAPLLAEAIRRLHEERSLTDLIVF